MEDEAGARLLAPIVSQFLKMVLLVQGSDGCIYFFSFCIFTYCNPFRTMCSQGY